MTAPPQQLLMGIAITAVCLLGLVASRWFLAETAKGRRLQNWFGDAIGLFVLRTLLGLGSLAGIALAADWIRPLTWD